MVFHTLVIPMVAVAGAGPTPYVDNIPYWTASPHAPPPGMTFEIMNDVWRV